MIGDVEISAEVDQNFDLTHAGNVQVQVERRIGARARRIDAGPCRRREITTCTLPNGATAWSIPITAWKRRYSPLTRYFSNVRE